MNDGNRERDRLVAVEALAVVTASTRTIHASGGRRAERAGE
ncbi:MAG TPA: hypothetical protein VMG82_20995 [Candidatus Sulfotelmatobacter sp.]|nr:hypothetical protein [Candidatus Sulfotelmatobacter sp.]